LAASPADFPGRIGSTADYRQKILAEQAARRGFAATVGPGTRTWAVPVNRLEGDLSDK
jgi:hypothetical protein